MPPVNAAKRSPAWAGFMEEVKGSKGSVKVNDGMKMEELSSIAAVLGCVVPDDCTTKRKIVVRINQLLAEEKSSDKHISQLKTLEGMSSVEGAARMIQLDTPAAADASAKRPASGEDSDNENDTAKRLKMDGEEDVKMSAAAGKKNATGASTERLYESTITSESEVHALEITAPLFASVRKDLVTKWGKVAGEVFDEMQREDIKWAEDMKFDQGSKILKKLDEIKVAKRYWPLFLSRNMLGLVNSAVVDTVVNKMAGARSLKESLKELKNVPTVYLTLSYSHGRKIRYRHLMIYLLRYFGMHKIKYPDAVIDLNLAEHEHIRRFFQELLEGCGKGGMSMFGRTPKKMGESAGAGGPFFQVSEQFDSFLDETLGMLSQVTAQVTEFKTKYNKHMSRAFAHGRKQGHDEGFKEGTSSGKDESYVVVMQDDV